jgi:hypothetical protein
MVRYSFSWREVLRTWGQWASAGLAAVPTGILLAVMLRKGIDVHQARIIAASLGLILALVLWNITGRFLAAPPVKQTTGISMNAVQFSQQSVPMAGSIVLYYFVESSTQSTALLSTAIASSHLKPLRSPVHAHAVSKL